MIEKIIKNIRKPYRILGIELKERWLSEEREHRISQFSRFISESVTVRQFYEALGINPKDSETVRMLAKQEEKKARGHILALNIYPKERYTSIDTFLSYHVPRELVSVTQEKVAKLKAEVFRNYEVLYNDAIPKSPAHTINHFLDEIVGLAWVTLSGGTSILDNYEISYRNQLTESLRLVRKRINEDIAHLMLATYFRFKDMVVVEGMVGAGSNLQLSQARIANAIPNTYGVPDKRETSPQLANK